MDPWYFWFFPKLKIAVKREEICDCAGATQYTSSVNGVSLLAD
jgi:hypothetical protein